MLILYSFDTLLKDNDNLSISLSVSGELFLSCFLSIISDLLFRNIMN